VLVSIRPVREAPNRAVKAALTSASQTVGNLGEWPSGDEWDGGRPREMFGIDGEEYSEMSDIEPDAVDWSYPGDSGSCKRQEITSSVNVNYCLPRLHNTILVKL